MGEAPLFASFFSVRDAVGAGTQALDPLSRDGYLKLSQTDSNRNLWNFPEFPGSPGQRDGFMFELISDQSCGVSHVFRREQKPWRFLGPVSESAFTELCGSAETQVHVILNCATQSFLFQKSGSCLV